MKLPIVIIFAAIVTAVSCGSQEVTDLRRVSEAATAQNQQVNKTGTADQAGSQPEASKPTTQQPNPTTDNSKPSRPGRDQTPSKPADPKPSNPKPTPTPKPTPQVNPTAGDNEPSLRFKTSCYQPRNDSCFLHQADSNNSGFYERLCRQGSRDARVTRGRNACAQLEITAKCSANFRGDKLIFYNIGKLTKAKDKELSDTCAGTEVLGQVIRGEYERFATPTD